MFVRLSHLAVPTLLATMFVASPLRADDDQGGTVIQDGRRLPTKIVPPKVHGKVIRRATPAQDTQPDATRPDSATQKAEPDDAERRFRAQLWERRVVREYGLGGYRAYRDRDADAPLSFMPPIGVCGLADPFTMQAAIEEAYSTGRYDEQFCGTRAESERFMNERKARILSKHDQALQSGLDELRAGEYARAVVGLTLAAKLDHGDPACRLHLAQARLALGHYQDAALSLRRALQLQPKLVYIDAHFDQYYPIPGTLKKFRGELDEWQKSNSASAEVNFLRGYVEFQCGDFAAAHRAFVLASDGLAKDQLTRDFLDVTKPGK